VDAKWAGVRVLIARRGGPGRACHVGSQVEPTCGPGWSPGCLAGRPPPAAALANAGWPLLPPAVLFCFVACNGKGGGRDSRQLDMCIP
jgi:hypothetical protein